MINQLPDLREEFAVDFIVVNCEKPLVVLASLQKSVRVYLVRVMFGQLVIMFGTKKSLITLLVSALLRPMNMADGTPGNVM